MRALFAYLKWQELRLAHRSQNRAFLVGWFLVFFSNYGFCLQLVWIPPNFFGELFGWQTSVDDLFGKKNICEKFYACEQFTQKKNIKGPRVTRGNRKFELFFQTRAFAGLAHSWWCAQAVWPHSLRSSGVRVRPKKVRTPKFRNFFLL